MKDIMATIEGEAAFQTLADVLRRSGLAETLKDNGPFTLFAPNNDAFTRLDLAEILEDSKKLVETLTYHVVERKMSREDILASDCAATLNGKTLAIKVKHGELVIDNAKVLETVIECSNGVIHVIDSVFLPHLSGWYGDCGCC